MDGSKAKYWIKFNPVLFAAILFFGLILILIIIRFSFKFNPSIEQSINPTDFDLAVSILFASSTSVLSFYCANYRIRTDNRVARIESFIKDFLSSQKAVKNILEDFEYIKFESINEIRNVVKEIDDNFGRHYFDIFIGNKDLTSIYISKEVGKFMVDINKRMKEIEKIFAKFKYEFNINEEKLINIVNIYIRNMNKKSKALTFGKEVLELLNTKKLDMDILISIIQLLENIDVFLTKDYINEVIKKLKIINESLWKKSTNIKRAVDFCQSHKHRDKISFCLKSQNSIMIHCIEKGW